jgi:hypothetical protein
MGVELRVSTVEAGPEIPLTGGDVHVKLPSDLPDEPPAEVVSHFDVTPRTSSSATACPWRSSTST